GQPLRPERRMSIVEIGHEPEAGDDVLFSALRSHWKIRPKDRQRHVSVVVGLAGYLAQMLVYRCKVADVEMGDFWGQAHARLPRLWVNFAGVTAVSAVSRSYRKANPTSVKAITCGKPRVQACV